MQLIAVETFPTKKLLRFAHRCPCDSMSDCGMSIQAGYQESSQMPHALCVYRQPGIDKPLTP